MNFASNYISNALFEFQRYKSYGDHVFKQLTEEDFFWQLSPTDNNIALIIKHLAGNMLSRWTNFLTEDGEKSWRDRDNEFTDPPSSKEELMELWEKGWNCLFNALGTINEDNFETRIRIRNQTHTIPEAINRQLAHYASHVGQLVLLGKMIKKEDWISPTIPKGQSNAFNQKMFGKNS